MTQLEGALRSPKTSRQLGPSSSFFYITYARPEGLPSLIADLDNGTRKNEVNPVSDTRNCGLRF